MDEIHQDEVRGSEFEPLDPGRPGGTDPEAVEAQGADARTRRPAHASAGSS